MIRIYTQFTPQKPVGFGTKIEMYIQTEKGVYGIISLQPYDSLFQDINLSLIYGLTVGIGIFLSITATTGFCLACNVRTPIVYVHISLLMLSCAAIFSSAIILLFYEVSTEYIDLPDVSHVTIVFDH